MLERIKEPSFKVVFTTAYEQYAIEAINEYDCLMYLLKPVDLDDLKKVIEKYHEASRNYFFYKVIKNNNKRHIVDIHEIRFCKASDNYCEIYLKESKFLVSKTLGVVHKKLGKNNFIRVNRSFIVNFQYVDHIDRLSGKVIFKQTAFIDGVFDEESEAIYLSNSKLKDLTMYSI